MKFLKDFISALIVLVLSGLLLGVFAAATVFPFVVTWRLVNRMI